MYRFSRTRAALLAPLAAGMLATMPAAHATEGGGSLYPLGADSFAAGAMPPPGIYGMLFTQHYEATRVNGAQGQNLHVPGFGVRANAVVPRFIWVTGTKVLGGDLSLHAITPLVDLNVAVGGARQHKTGLGDITVGPGLGYHHSERLHSLVGVDFYLPTGGYRRGDLANIGRNYSAIEPLYILSYIDPAGLNADIKAGYLVNQRNSATDYRSGHEFHFDYALGWGLGNSWTVGAGGYYYFQTTKDHQGGVALDDSKGRAFAIGPAVKYDSGKGWFATLKWQKETHAVNRAQGSALWFKAVFPL